MKILILNPPSKEGIYINRDQMGGMGQKISFGKSLLTTFLRRMKSSFIRQPVVQLVYAATILSKNHDVLVIDALNENLTLKEIVDRIKKFKPDYTFMAISSSDIIFEREVAGIIKKETGSKIITIGDAITNAHSLFKEPFDIAIIGEIERVVEEIVDEPVNKIKGIIYLKDKKIKVNMPGELLSGEELDKLPFPKWELFPYKKYRYYPLLFKEPAVSMLSSRGCPYACYYCSYSKNEGRKLRMRSAENVVEEIENNVKKYRIKGTVFRDPLFTGSRERTEKICKLLVDKNIEAIWACETRPELLSKDILKVMQKAGCRAINMGIESVHEAELKSVGRFKIDLNQARKVFEICNKIGIRTTGFFILGLPNSTKKSMNETIKFSRDSGLNHAEYKVATPYPGTKLREIAIRNKWIKEQELENLGGYDAVMEIGKDINKKYLGDLCDRAFKDFYYRKSWVLKELRKDTLKKFGFLTKTAFRAFVNK